MVKYNNIFLLLCMFMLIDISASSQSLMESLIDQHEIGEVNDLYYRLYRKSFKKNGQKAIPREELDFVNVFLLNYTGDCSLDSIYNVSSTNLF